MSKYQLLLSLQPIKSRLSHRIKHTVLLKIDTLAWIHLLRRKQNSKRTLQLIANELVFRFFLFLIRSSWKCYLPFPSFLYPFTYLQEFFFKFVYDLHLANSFESIVGTGTWNLCFLKIVLELTDFVVERRCDELKLVFLHYWKFLHIFILFYLLLKISHIAKHLVNVIFPCLFLILFLSIRITTFNLREFSL